MTRRMLVPLFVLALAVPALADEKVDAKKLKGTWVREVEGVKLQYQFKDDKTMIAKLTPGGADQSMVIDVEYTLDKDNVLSGVLVKVEANGLEGAPTKGDKFSFKIEVGKETLIVSDFKGIEGEQVKKLVEGEYKKRTD